MYVMACQLAALGIGAIFTSTRSLPAIETGNGLLTQWTWPPAIVVPLLLMAGLYGFGVARMRRREIYGRKFFWQILCFALGWISLVAALDSPLHELGEQLFWVHMTQHEILMLISAPLLVLGRPLIAFLWALPRVWREAIARVARLRIFKKAWAFASAPLSAWLVSAL